MDHNDRRYSFSGSDCEAWAFFPGSNRISEYIKRQLKLLESTKEDIDDRSELDSKQKEAATQALLRERDKLANLQNHYLSNNLNHLDALATCSISVTEPKGLVRQLGKKNIVGKTRSIRTIAGSMIFTIIDRHPLERLMLFDPFSLFPGEERKYALSWSKDMDKGVGSWDNPYATWLKLPTLISPFTVMFTYVSEYPTVMDKLGNVPASTLLNGRCSLMLEGVEFVSQGQVTSISDMVTEISFQFVAENIYDFSLWHMQDSASPLMPPTVREIIEAQANIASKAVEGRMREGEGPVANRAGIDTAFLEDPKVERGKIKTHVGRAISIPKTGSGNYPNPNVPGMAR